MDIVDGYVMAGTRVTGTEALENLLRKWGESSDARTVGNVDKFGGSPVLTVELSEDVFVLNRDTTRDAVKAFLTAASIAGNAARLPWHVCANRRGVINRVTYRHDDEPTPGWYAYLRPSASGPRTLR